MKFFENPLIQIFSKKEYYTDSKSIPKCVYIIKDEWKKMNADQIYQIKRWSLNRLIDLLNSSDIERSLDSKLKLNDNEE